MSDIQGASDTASGGLENDMPSIGAAPPSPRQTPSALGGVAQFARQALGIGAPALRPAQPRGAPFPQGPQGPPPPPNQRWQGTTASLFLPRGSNQPPARFSPFIGAFPRGDFRKWGQPDEYGAMPQSFEAPSIAQGLSQFFGQAGGGMDLTAIMALGMGRYAGDYIKGVMAGEEYRTKVAKEKWLEHQMMLQDQLETRHQIYADRIGEYAAVAGTDDPAKLVNASIKGVSLRDALYQDAAKTGDTDIMNMLDEGVSFDKILRYQDLRDSKLKDLQKTTAKMQEQDAADNKEREAAGLPPKPESASAGGGVDPFSLGRQTPTAIAGGPQPDTGAPAQTPANPNAPAPNAQTVQGEGEPPPLLPYQEDANGVVRGEINPNSLSKAIRPGVMDEAARRGAQLDQIKAGVASGRIKQEDIPAALDRVIPGAGQEYTNTLEGAPLPTQAAGRSKYWQTIRGLIPGFNPIVQAQTMRDFAPGGKDGTRIIAGWRMGPAAANVLKALKNIPEGEVIPYYMADMLIAGKYTGDPKYTGLFNALNSYIQEAQALNSPTGRFFVTEVESIKHQLQTTTGPRAIRTILQQDAETSTKLIDGLRDVYKRNSRRQEDPPTYDPNNTEILRAIVNLDPTKGFEGIPDSRLPPELHGLGLGAGVDPQTGKKINAPEPGLPGGWNWK